jgi:uncharacterized protein involved in outer membrane biogenesis
MKRVVKWGFVLIGAMILLVIALLLIVPNFIDIEKYKPEIEKRISDATGRPFTLGGDLRLSLFPWVGLNLSDLHLGNPPGFEEKEFISVRTFEMRVKVLPLLSRDVEVKRFVMEDPRIVLEKRKDGRENWENILESKEPPPSREEPKKPEEKPQKGLPIEALTVGEFSIKRGSLLWVDHTKNERREIKDLDLRLQDLSLDRPIGINLSAKLDEHPIAVEGKIGPVGKEPGKGPLPLNISVGALDQLDVKISGNLVDAAVRPQFDLALQVAPFSPRKLLALLDQAVPVVTSDPQALTNVALKAHIQGTTEAVSISDGILDMDESHVTFSGNAKEFTKPNVAFALNVDRLNVDRYLPPSNEKPSKNQGEAKAANTKSDNPSDPPNDPDFSPLRTLILDGTVQVGQLKIRGVQVQDIQLKVMGKEGVFQIDPFSLKLLEGTTSIKGSFDVRQEVPKFDLALQTSAFSPRKLFEATGQTFPVETADPNALNSVAFKATVQGTTNDVTVKDGALDLDESHLTFSLRAREFSKPALNLQLDLDQIDLDRYLPPKEEETATKIQEKASEKPRGTTEKASPETGQINYAPLRKLVLDASIHVGKLKVQGAQLEGLNLACSAKDGIIQLDPFNMKLYEGDASAVVALNVQQDSPKEDVQLKAKGIQVEPFLKDFMKKDFLGGTMQANFDLSMKGDAPDQIKRSLNGKGELFFKDGYINGIDIPGMVRNVKATFGLAEKGAERPRTDFSELHSPFTLTNGLFETTETSLKSPLLRVQAGGKADLVQETLDFRVAPKFVATLKGQGDKKERAGVMVPILISGTFSSLTFSPDLEGIIRQGIGDLQIPDLQEGLPKGTDLKEGLPKLPDVKEGLQVPSELKEVLPQTPDIEKGLPQSTEVKEPTQGQVSPLKEEKKKRKEKAATESPLEEKAQDFIKSLPTGK